MLWEAPPMWRGETAFLLGGGPSLPLNRIEELRSYNVIAINQAWRIAHWAEVLYFGDCQWYEWNKAILHRFKGYKVTLCAKCRYLPDYYGMRCRANTGLDNRPGWLASTSSGYAAINLAYHFGCSRIVLLGYDMQARSGTKNWHKDYPVEQKDLYASRMLPPFYTLVEPLAAAGVEVINCTEGSALDMFPRQSLDKVLSKERKRAKSLHRSQA